MSCNPELVSAFLDGELDDVIVDTVAQHLMKCDTCCKTLSVLAQVRDALTERFTLRDPEGLTASVMAAIRGEKSGVATPGGVLARGMNGAATTQLQQRLVRFGVPAALAAAALAGWLQGQEHSHQGNSLTSPPHSPSGNNQTQRLADNLR